MINDESLCVDVSLMNATSVDAIWCWTYDDTKGYNFYANCFTKCPIAAHGL